MKNTYPSVGFSFNVEFLGGTLQSAKIGFQSVTGLSVEMQLESLKEGGENRFEYNLPTRKKYSPLVLKRGLTQNTKIIKWCSETMLNFDIQPVNLQITLLNASQKPLMIWDVINAWPKKWSVSDFDAEKSAIAIETLELNYQYFEPKPV
ncbi:glycerol acyltransferase [filamentous cyanobacterium CCP3]|nr:glycerol acyltransferase [filamentous cyanobacterium CCP3]